VSRRESESPMSLSFGGADAPSAHGSQPRSSDLAEFIEKPGDAPGAGRGPAPQANARMRETEVALD
jgi:hypothetical protein